MNIRYNMWMQSSLTGEEKHEMSKPKSEEVLKGESKTKKPRIRKTDSVNLVDAENNVVGKEVHGIVDGSFDAGYFLTVRVDGSPLVLRGLVFEQGLFVPLSNVNDIAPKVKTVVRNENVEAPLHERQNGEIGSLKFSAKEPKTDSKSQDSLSNPHLRRSVGSLLEEDRETLGEEHPVLVKDEEMSVEKECIDTSATTEPEKSSSIADQMAIDPMHAREAGCGENDQRTDEMNTEAMVIKGIIDEEKSPIADEEKTIKHEPRKEIEPTKSASVISDEIARKTMQLKGTKLGESSLIDDHIAMIHKPMHLNEIPTEVDDIMPNFNSLTGNQVAVKPMHISKESALVFVDKEGMGSRKISVTTDPKGAEPVITVTPIDSNGEEISIQEEGEMGTKFPSRDNERGNLLFKTETTPKATEQEFIDVWPVNHGERYAEAREREHMLIDSSGEESKLHEHKEVQSQMVIEDHEDNVQNSEENTFEREIPQTTEQEFIDVWQVNHGERCFEARERELMTVVEAQLCGLASTGAECTWTKSITDSMDLSGNISDTDGQPNDSLFE